MTTNGETNKTPAPPVASAISIENAIAIFNGMQPDEDVMMVREMEEMFPSILVAKTNGVSDQQVIAVLRQKWPNLHVATIIRLLNSERDRRLALGECIACNPFGTPRKSKRRDMAADVDGDQAANAGSAGRTA